MNSYQNDFAGWVYCQIYLYSTFPTACAAQSALQTKKELNKAHA